MRVLLLLLVLLTLESQAMAQQVATIHKKYGCLLKSPKNVLVSLENKKLGRLLLFSKEIKAVSKNIRNSKSSIAALQGRNDRVSNKKRNKLKKTLKAQKLMSKGMLACKAGSFSSALPAGCLADGQACDDLNPCTTGDICNNLKCSGTPIQGKAISCGFSKCSKKLLQCSDARLVACAYKAASEELCNGFDDDCNGAVDEGGVCNALPTATPVVTVPSNGCVHEGGNFVMDNLTIKCAGPALDESTGTNPFYDYRMEVTFTKGSKSYIVPGYFAADGNAANSSAVSGNQFHARFRPDEAGSWNYQVSFRTGPKAAISNTGSAVAFNGANGGFNVGNGSSSTIGAMANGRLVDFGNGYMGTRLNNRPVIKLGAGTPENFLSYSEFDSPKSGATNYNTHIGDWKAGDPSWGNGKGKGIIGVLNYLASTGSNALYIMFTNIDSDNSDVTPHLGGYENADVERYDVSKLEQWYKVFEHANKAGIILNLFFHDDESGSRNLFGSAGDSDDRKLYFREMVARFGNLPLIQWDISEEYNKSWSSSQVIQAANVLVALDPYKSIPISVHTTNISNGSDLFNAFFPLGWFSPVTLQIESNVPSNIASATEHWLNKARNAAGRTIPVSVDEPKSFAISENPETSEAMAYSLIFSGGWGLQLYEGTSSTDARVSNFRLADATWRSLGIARRFSEENLPLGSMLADDSASSGASGAEQVFRSYDRSVFAVYYPDGSSPGTLDFGSSANRQLRWFNPRSGVFDGGTYVISGSSTSMPAAPSGDSWVALINQ